MGVRVTAGSLRGRSIPIDIAPSSGGSLRPTSSKVRQAIFNILAGRITDAVFVDLYAGTGAVGIEAMSRGAKSVFFVEEDKKRSAAIEGLLSGCGCRPRAVVINKSAKEFILKSKERFDIVFLDPPYRAGEILKLLPVLGAGESLSNDSVVMAEHLTKETLPDEVGVLVKKKTYKYGDTSLTLYARSK